MNSGVKTNARPTESSTWKPTTDQAGLVASNKVLHHSARLVATVPGTNSARTPTRS